MRGEKPYKIAPLTGLQRLMCDLHAESCKYWMLPCWIDVNMRRCFAERSAQEREGESKITYTAYFIKAIADSIREAMPQNPEFNAAMTRFPWKRLVCFSEVDAAVAVECRHEGRDFFFVGIIRDADRKTAQTIREELASFQVPDSASFQRAFASLHSLTHAPGIARRLLLWAGRSLPGMIVKHRGTFFISTVGKYGVGMYLMSNHNLSFSFGEVAPRPVADGAAIAIAPMTTLTVVYDHRVMVGAPVARLMARIRERIECGGEEGPLKAEPPAAGAS